jgi:alkylhydroperoxidase/carboxymuconolactone decarboxylase family protein YurZ
VSLPCFITAGNAVSIHSCSLGAPILLEEAHEAGIQLTTKQGETPACDQMKEIGQWNQAWNPFYELDPVWTEQFMATGLGIYASSLLSPKLVELLSIAFDASITHLYAPGTRRHIKAALKLGATMEEIMEVLKICVSFGLESCYFAVPILDQELAAFENQKSA